ncbi:hypothetical protein J2X69_002401 [Algoriphagus sp. 4150]|uniref:BACON domain-containing protein n=1 Tax=Algoriphagus sp. 4150 TaxID=2817756 RepID=UPI002857E8AA|nr:BACON domain-containing carbohydrate-binding protein [Algoriphagus sp. 4150]MDR7130054.1 hypothetical protein [Algoriphagus sp. 4150]
MNSFGIPAVIIILILSLFTPLYSNAQSTSWGKPVVAGQILNDYFISKDGGHYSAGTNYLLEHANYNEFSFPNISNGISNFANFLIKADSSHRVEWLETFYNSKWTYPPNIAVDQDNNMYVSFGFRSTIQVGPVLLNVDADEPRIALLKLDPNRELIWMNYIKPTDPLNDDLINYNLKISHSGNIYLSGNCGGSYGFYDSKDNLLHLNTWEERTAFISKYSSDGELIWAKTLPEGGNLNSTFVFDIDFDKSDNVYFTGTHYWEGNFQGVSHMTPYQQLMVGSLSSDGNLNWIEFLGNQNRNDGPNIGYGVAIDDNLEAVYVTGTLRTTYGNESSTEGRTAVLFRLDFSGNYIWHKRMGSSMGLASLGPSGSAVAVDKNGDPIVSGLFWNKGTFGDFEMQAPRDPNVGNNYLGIFVTKLSSSGEFLWADFAGSNYEDKVNGMIIHTPGELTLYGNTRRGAVFGENRIGMDESLDLGFIATLRYSDPKFLVVGTNYFTFDTGEKTDSLFEISSNVNWTITSDQEWLVTEKSQGSGNSLVNFSVKENFDSLSRNASLTVIGENGQKETINVHQEKGFDLITVIPPGKESEVFKVFPNPIQSSYTIQLPKPAKTLTLYNSEGRMVSELNPSLLKQEADYLVPGVYYLIVVFEDGVSVKKLIKL